MESLVRLGFFTVLTFLVYKIATNFLTKSFAFIAAIGVVASIFMGFMGVREGLTHDLDFTSFQLNGNMLLDTEKSRQIMNMAFSDLMARKGSVKGYFS